MKKAIFWFIGIFAIALFILFSYNFLVSGYAETPLLRLTEFGSSFFDKPSPGNWIKENQILLYEDRIVIFIPNATISTYANTNSMDPVFDSTANGIEIVPQGPEDIHVGDIIAYESNPGSNMLIVHRVIEIGIDKEGWYCIPKGDNAIQDDGKIRFQRIKYITIGILW
ncbi:MAG: hypothetical protein IB618_04060 [Candidatus Pacearchaeota archaeon]|nr:MAG: hypothetical protein IB618_04060 [Candidatus Pacearchaeota archaeon]